MRRAAAPHGSPLRGRIISAMFKCPPVRVRGRAPCKVRLAPHLSVRALRAQERSVLGCRVSFFERGRIASWRLLGPNVAQT
jgi:hypothetical protein